MTTKLLSVLAAVFLLAACASDSSTGSSATGSGGGANGGSGSAGSAAPGSYEDLVANVGDRVFFGYDSYALSADARKTLEKQAAWLARFPAVKITVEGHCDERGTREYNLALGERRANAVKDYLVALGVNAGRVTTISYGKEQPVAFGSTEAAWTQNRRGVTTLSGAGS
ncbi:MAG: peptidoglycan-associated lipoprotein Pal [Rhodospirillales bacterium]